MKNLLFVLVVLLMGCDTDDTKNTEPLPLIEPPSTPVVEEQPEDDNPVVEEVAEEEVDDEPPEETPPPPPALGTPLTEPYCGKEETFLTLLALVQDVADGNGGVKTEIVEENSLECGYEPPPPQGTVFEAFCDGEDFITVEADGNGGSVEIKEENQLMCGYMPSCPVVASGDDANYPYVDCYGNEQSTPVEFPFTPESNYKHIIDILFVIDSRLNTDDLSVEAFIEREIDYAHSVYDNSGVKIRLRIADIKIVDTSDRGLRRQVEYFTTDRAEYENVSQWQKEANADLAHLFIERPNDPQACGVAYLDASIQPLKRRRGVTQCFQGDVFQEFESIRYYNRAHETFTHEIGHNLGLEHDERNTSGYGIFPFSYGYVLPNTQTIIDGLRYNGIGTIMSYADEPTQSFSDPNQYYTKEDGTSVPTGNNNDACFGIECTPPKLTNATKHLNIVRHTMSKLNEQEEQPLFSNPLYVPIDLCVF